MSVNRADGRDTGYENLEVQVLDTDLNIESDASTGGYSIPQYHSFEPLGGIQRGEVAELVAVMGQVTLSHEGIGGNTDPGSCRSDWELSLDPEINGGLQLQSTTSLGGRDGIDLHSASRLDPDMLQNYDLRVGNLFDQIDTTNGTGSGGGGTTYASYDVQIDYRDLLGGGPTLDRHDNVYQHVDLTLVGDTNSEYQLSTRELLYWDVKEEQ